MAVRVVVADDSLLVREGVQHLLEDVPEIELVASCEDGPSLLEAVQREEPDVVLTDIRMPPSQESEGIEIAKTLRRSHPGVGVVVLSQFADARYVVALLESGSAGRGYLLKERLADREQLLRALEDVAAGGSVIDPRVVEVLVDERRRTDESPLGQLTARELEILRYVATGRSNSAIAGELMITKRAVERHINSIFSKLQLADETQVSRRVMATLLFLSDSVQPDPH
jgi:DNA-binding NarL/FixJ family response regulator